MRREMRDPSRLEVDETRSPMFGRREFVAAGPTCRARRALVAGGLDLDVRFGGPQPVQRGRLPARRPRYDVRLRAAQGPGSLFPFDVGPYTCLAEAYLVHQRTLGVLADYARRRGLDVVFAHRNAEGKLAVAAPRLAWPARRCPATSARPST